MKQHTTTPLFIDSVREALGAAGLGGAHEVSHTVDSAEFGNAEAVFRIHALLLRFVRDRGQVFVDLASSASPTEFHELDNVEIGMGWKTIDEVLAKREPEELGAVLGRLRENLEALNHAFSDEREHLTRARVERAARERGQVFTARLRDG